MRNRIVGFIVLGIVALIGFIIYSFNKTMTEIVNTSCDHGPACPMWGSINFQTNISISIMIFISLIGFYLIYFGKEENNINNNQNLIIPEITEENYKNILNFMNLDEKTVLKKIIESQGTIFQSDLVEKTDFSKVKITRILDRFEGKGLIERKRRGMTNVIILKKLNSENNQLRN